MHSFQGQKHEWRIHLTLAAVRRVKNLLGFNLLEPNKQYEGTPLLTHLYTDMLDFMNVLFVVLEPQAKERNITDEMFAEEMSEEEGTEASELEETIYMRAHVAFFEEVIDFFHRNGQQEKAAAVSVQVRSMKATQTEIWEQAQTVDVETPTREKVQSMNLNQKVGKAIRGVKLTDSPESSVSSPMS